MRYPMPGYSIRRCLPSRSRALIAACICALAATTFSGALLASPVLRCQFSQSGSSRVVDFSPVKDPYGVEAIDINGNFRFKAVVIGDDHQVEYIKLYTYYVSRRQPVLLHEAKYLAPVIQAGTSSTALTGLNSLYSPRLERELQYGCALLEAAP